MLNSTLIHNEAEIIDEDAQIGLIHSNSEGNLTDFSENTINQTKFISPFSTVMNLLNSLVGAEILNISNTMRFGGLYLSVGLITMTALLSYIATIMTVRLQSAVKAESLHDLAVKLLGRFGSQCLVFLTLLFTFSCSVAYLIVGGDSIASWFKLLGFDIWNFGWRRSIVILVYAIILPVLLTIPKKMTFLSMFSTFSIFCLVIFIIVMVIKAYPLLMTLGINPTTKSFDINLGFFNSLAIYSLMFALPAICLPLIKDTHPSLSHRFRIVGSSFMTCYLFVLIPGILGYLCFGNDTKEIILQNFPDKDLVIQLIRVAFFIVVTASYPVIALSICADLSAILFHVNLPNSLPDKQRVVVLLIANIPPVFIAMVCPVIQPVLAVGGALGGCLTNFFFPSLLWISYSDKKRSHWTIILTYLFALFGLVSAIIATYRAVIVAIFPMTDE